MWLQFFSPYKMLLINCIHLQGNVVAQPQQFRITCSIFFEKFFLKTRTFTQVRSKSFQHPRQDPF